MYSHAVLERQKRMAMFLWSLNEKTLHAERISYKILYKLNYSCASGVMRAPWLLLIMCILEEVRCENCFPPPLLGVNIRHQTSWATESGQQTTTPDELWWN